MSSKNGGSILAILAGAAIGVGLGVLFAPDKGSKTREKIKGNVDDLKVDVINKLADIEEEIRGKIPAIKENFKDKFDNILSNTSYKTEDAITILEEKLAELKKQNAKFQK